MRLAPLAAVALPLGFVAAQPRPVPRPETIGLSAPALARIKPALQAYVDAGKLAGIVGVVARHGKVGYLETVGRMDLALQTPMRADAVFRIFSMTKPVIAVAVLRLMDQGKLQLEDPVSKFIPAFGPVKVYAGGSAASELRRVPWTLSLGVHSESEVQDGGTTAVQSGVQGRGGEVGNRPRCPNSPPPGSCCRPSRAP